MGGSVSGIRESKVKFAALRAAIRAETPGLVDDVMKQTAHKQRDLLSRGQHRSGTPTGSVPPSPPWAISGALARAATYDPATEFGHDRWRGAAGPSRRVPYVRIHELGGWAGRNHRTYLPPRPSLRPAWHAVKPTVTRTCARGWARATHAALQ